MQLHSTLDVITALGGSAEVARLTGRTVPAASNWRKFIAFPSDTYLVMRDALREKGLSAPLHLWGMVEPAKPDQAHAHSMS